MSDLPLVVVLDGPDCSIEQKALQTVAQVHAADVTHIDQLPAQVMEKTSVCLLYHIVNLDRTALLKFPKLKGVIRYGAGYDNVDLKAAAENNVIVCNVPAFATEEVADSTMAHLLQLLRRTHTAARAVQGGRQFTDMKAIIGSATGARRLKDMVLGIVGLGRIGTAVAQRAKPFGFQIYFYDPLLVEGAEKGVGLNRVNSLRELLQVADCLTLHCPMNHDNFHMIDAQAISYMKTGAFLVNTARGGLVDDKAIAEALKSGKLAGVSTDVHENEPNNVFDGPLANTPNYTNTPHNAWFSASSQRELHTTAARRVKQILNADNDPSKVDCCLNKQFF